MREQPLIPLIVAGLGLALPVEFETGHPQHIHRMPACEQDAGDREEQLHVVRIERGDREMPPLRRPGAAARLCGHGEPLPGMACEVPARDRDGGGRRHAAMERGDGVADAGDVGRALQRHLAQLRPRLERRRAPRAPRFFQVVDGAAQVAAPLLQRRKLVMAMGEGLRRGLVGPPQPVDLARLLGGAGEHAQHAAIAPHRRIQISPPLLRARDVRARRGVVQQGIGPGEPFRVGLVNRRMQAVATDLGVGIGDCRLGVAHGLALDLDGPFFPAAGVEQPGETFARIQRGGIEPDQRVEMPDRLVDPALQFIDLGQREMRGAACGIERRSPSEGVLGAGILAEVPQQRRVVA